MKLGQYIHAVDRFLAGEDEYRAEDLMNFFMDDEIKAIMAISGGYGSQRIVPLLDYDLIKARPKYLIGLVILLLCNSHYLKKQE